MGVRLLHNHTHLHVVKEPQAVLPRGIFHSDLGTISLNGSYAHMLHTEDTTYHNNID